MALPVFIQNSMYEGRAVFQVAKGSLEVTTWGLPSRGDKIISLQEIDPSYQKVTRFRFVAAGVSLSLSVFFGWAGVKLQGLHPSLMLLAELTILPCFLTGILGLRGLLPFTHYAFKSSVTGKPLFEVHREIFESRECDIFIAQLGVCLQSLDANLSPKEIDAYLLSLDLPPPKPAEWKWKASLVFSLSAASMPWVPGLMEYLSYDARFFTMVGFTGGVLLSYWSFNRDEKYRWLTIAGIALAALYLWPVVYA